MTILLENPIKDLRLSIDGVIQRAEAYNDISGQMVLLKQHLLYAKAFLGEILKEHGGTDPYKEYGRVWEIPPTAEKAPKFAGKMDIELPNDRLRVIQLIKGDIEHNIFELGFIKEKTVASPLCFDNVKAELLKAKFCTGFMIAELRNEYDLKMQE